MYVYAFILGTCFVLHVFVIGYVLYSAYIIAQHTRMCGHIYNKNNESQKKVIYLNYPLSLAEYSVVYTTLYEWHEHDDEDCLLQRMCYGLK